MRTDWRSRWLMMNFGRFEGNDMNEQETQAYAEGRDAFTMRNFINPYDEWVNVVANKDWERGYEDAREAALQAQYKRYEDARAVALQDKMKSTFAWQKECEYIGKVTDAGGRAPEMGNDIATFICYCEMQKENAERDGQYASVQYIQHCIDDLTQEGE